MTISLMRSFVCALAGSRAHKRGLGLALMAIVCLAPALQGQQAGTVNGTVTDPTQAAVPAVRVTIENTATHITRSTVTGPEGFYSFPSTEPGNYTLTVEGKGFKKTVVPKVTVEVAQTVRLDVTLELGAVAESVQVEATALQLQTADSQMGGVVPTKAISDLPLNGRNFTQLMVLMAGAVEGSAGNVVQGHYSERAGGQSFSVNGQRSDYNEYLIDGFMAKEVQHETNSIEPIIDALREFRVQTSNYGAEFGVEAGGQINAVMKSGTNDFHGSAWEFVRNSDFDANNYFNNLSRVGIPAFRRNQFGVSAGGPVWLPKLYNGKNRTFIFGAYEGTRVSKGITQLSTVPSAALRSGDFSGLAPVTDPLSGAPFPNNIIPASRQSAINNTILQRWVPLPNNPGGGVLNWISTDPQTIGVEQYDWRIDHRISDSDSIFGHYLFEDTDFHYPRLFPTDGASQKLRGQNLLAAWTHLFSPKTLSEFRVGYSRFRENEFQARAGKENVVQELGMQGLCENPKCWGIPQMNVTGFASFGEHGGQNVSGPRGWRNEVYQMQESLYHTAGAHSLKAGITVARHRDTFPEAIYPRGSFGYNGFLTGSPFADYLLGDPYSTLTSIDVFDPHFRNTEVGPWFQDDWRVSSELTVNLGLRWEWSGRPTSDDNSISSVLFLPGQQAQLLTARDPGPLPRALAYNDFDNFAPRVGFAYSPKFLHGKTVFRGAYGIFYQREAANTWIDIAINVPFIRQTQIFLDKDPTSPFYFGNYNLQQPTALAPPKPLLVFSMDPNWRDGMVQQWNFNLQQEVAHNMVLQVAYVGNHSSHLARETVPNQPLPGPGPVQPRRPYQGFGTIYGLDTNADANYNGLQIQLEKRYSSGLEFITAYTFSKCIDNSGGTFVGEGGVRFQDNNNFRGMRGLCAQDSRQRFSESFVYDMPFGRGRHFGRTMNRAADLLVGGWQVNGIITLRSGQPFTVTTPTDVSNTADGPTFADLVGNPNSVANQSIYNWFNKSAFTLPQPYHFGNSGRNIVIGPGLNNWDLSMFKSFHIDEQRQLQFRAETFNTFNHAQFGFPGSTLNTPQFGIISGTSKDPRDVQLSLKFLW